MDVRTSDTALRVKTSAKWEGRSNAADTRAFHPYRSTALAVLPPAAAIYVLERGTLSTALIAASFVGLATGTEKQYTR